MRFRIPNITESVISSHVYCFWKKIRYSGLKVVRYLETYISYHKIQKSEVENMKNWKKVMAMLCTAAMITGFSAPVWAEADAAEETRGS